VLSVRSRPAADGAIELAAVRRGVELLAQSIRKQHAELTRQAIRIQQLWDGLSGDGSLRAFEVEPMVTDGEDARGRFPEVCALVGGHDPEAATGVVLHKNLVLTASHAVDRGTLALFPADKAAPPSAADPRLHRLARDPIRHPNRNVDLALLVIERTGELPFQPARLAGDADWLLAFQRGGRMVGFGYGVESPQSGRGAKRISSAPVRLIPEGDPSVDPTIDFVAFHPHHALCAGDSGGPLYLYGSDPPVVLGIAKRVLQPPCAGESVYARVDLFAGWIRETAAQQGIALG